MSAPPARTPSPTCDQRTPEDGGDDAPPAGAEGHADADLTRASRHDERQHRVDPGEREQQGDGRHHDRDSQPQPDDPQNIVRDLVHPLQLREAKRRIHRGGDLAKLWAERHRIAPHVHHHVDPVESVRGGRKVETCRASLSRGCAHPELLHDADDLEPGIGALGGRIVRILRRIAPAGRWDSAPAAPAPRSPDRRSRRSHRARDRRH